MIVAFAGWPDAAESATKAVLYLAKKLSAKKFAEIDPEEFYDFTIVRPETKINPQGKRTMSWPANDFYYFTSKDTEQSVILFNGTEPNLRWRAYSRNIATIAEQCGVKFVVTLGALLDAVPHTRETKVSGRASSEELAQKVEWLGIRSSGYQGPTGIHSAFLSACDEQGLSHASIWGHCPHYVSTSPNSVVSHALLTKLRSLVDFDVDMDELREEGEGFEDEVEKAISKELDVTAYVRRLEQRHDEANELSGDIPSSDDMVKELEEFLKSQRHGPDIGREL
jgi:proteasome assembly chaperone (PAC2) family protein